MCIPAHDSKMEERIEDYRKITTSLDLPKIVAAKQYKSDGKQLCWIGGSINFEAGEQAAEHLSQMRIL